MSATTNRFVIETIHRRIVSEHERAKAEMISELESLSHRIQSALEAVRSGSRVDGFLIANAGITTATIARWNLASELRPMIEFEPPPELEQEREAPPPAPPARRRKGR